MNELACAKRESHQDADSAALREGALAWLLLTVKHFARLISKFYQNSSKFRHARYSPSQHTYHSISRAILGSQGMGSDLFPGVNEAEE